MVGVIQLRHVVLWPLPLPPPPLPLFTTVCKLCDEILIKAWAMLNPPFRQSYCNPINCYDRGMD